MTSAPDTTPGDTFAVEHAHLVHRVVPRRGTPYVHRCTLANFESIAEAIDDIGKLGFTLDELAEVTDLPHTQVAVAVAFLKERGCIETAFRRNYPASADVFLDAMVEYWALAEPTKGAE